MRLSGDRSDPNLSCRAQLDTLLETVSDMLRIPGWHKYRFRQEAIRTIYYMNNRLAKPWLEKHHNNSTWLKTFPNVDMGFDPLPFEVNDAIDASLGGMGG